MATAMSRLVYCFVYCQNLLRETIFPRQDIKGVPTCLFIAFVFTNTYTNTNIIIL